MTSRPWTVDQPFFDQPSFYQPSFDQTSACRRNVLVYIEECNTCRSLRWKWRCKACSRLTENTRTGLFLNKGSLSLRFVPPTNGFSSLYFRRILRMYRATENQWDRFIRKSNIFIRQQSFRRASQMALCEVMLDGRDQGTFYAQFAPGIMDGAI